ncbi:hypothetical protein LguiB_004065 [Lonicera macranthoides]
MPPRFSLSDSLQWNPQSRSIINFSITHSDSLTFMYQIWGENVERDAVCKALISLLRQDVQSKHLTVTFPKCTISM